MNLREASGRFRNLLFRGLRRVACLFPGSKIHAFGLGAGRIGAILVLNLDRQPARWNGMVRELGRLRTFDGTPLTSIASRFRAVDARDGRAVAATADVDPNYRLRDQLYVQPDSRLEECFGADTVVRMTRQEVAVARSHIEIWKSVAKGQHQHVLVLEDDVWFTPGAAVAIDCGWRTALERGHSNGGPHLLYLSYADAGGSAARADVCEAIFRPLRGLWFLSGYVLSREGAAALLRAMPVIGPVDTWINYRFQDLGALALTSPVILQRPDCTSDNSYSVLPYLARAGIVDVGSGPMPPLRNEAGPAICWSGPEDRESLAMSLSILGLRVRAFDGDEPDLTSEKLVELLKTFDAIVDAPLSESALITAISSTNAKFILATDPANRRSQDPFFLPSLRTLTLRQGELESQKWEPICTLLGLPVPPEPFPSGAHRRFRLFRDDRTESMPADSAMPERQNDPLDDSPWVLPSTSGWKPRLSTTRYEAPTTGLLICSAMTTATPFFVELVETFPGNQASFAKDGLTRDAEGTHLNFENVPSGSRPYRSGAFASTCTFAYGRFEASIKAALGSGLVTGLFLHRSAPRQEIDLELLGNDPRAMLVNVYFNPGDEGTAMAFGYRGAPLRINLDFDTTESFHLYAIDWRPGLVTWSVDNKVVHERVGWDPTPVPHLPMRLHANLWAPRSEELAGKLDENALPAKAAFRNVSVWA